MYLSVLVKEYIQIMFQPFLIALFLFYFLFSSLLVFFCLGYWYKLMCQI